MLNYVDIIYQQTFHQKIESVQYNTCPTITGAIAGTSEKKRYKELVLVPFNATTSVENYGTFTNFSKMNLLVSYILKLVPIRHSLYITRNAKNTFFQNNNHVSKKSFHDLSC